MKIQYDNLMPIEFDGLEIRDYTADQKTSSSIAEVTIPPGVRHRRAYSRKSDKYYYVIEGSLNFVIGEYACTPSAGDVCIIPKGVRFSYKNKSEVVAKVLLVHTPSFDLAEEVFEE